MLPTPSEASTITGPMNIRQSMWRQMMRQSRTPLARAAVIKSCSRRLSMSARTTRA